jgi:hypothetical protein
MAARSETGGASYPRESGTPAGPHEVFRWTLEDGDTIEMIDGRVLRNGEPFDVVPQGRVSKLELELLERDERLLRMRKGILRAVYDCERQTAHSGKSHAMIGHDLSVVLAEELMDELGMER